MRNDPLVEVRSSVETARITVARGQWLDYWFCVNGNTEPLVVSTKRLVGSGKGNG